MEFKDYQQSVLDTFDAYLAELLRQKENVLKIVNLKQEHPEIDLEIGDFASKTWGLMKDQRRLPKNRANFPYNPRQDGIGLNVPNVCLKVPTGGGKTLLAAASVSRVVNRLWGRNTGFLLWIVPNEAIYSQTKKALTNREHPYRQILDKAGAGRVKFLEKNSRLDVRDIENNLCIMLLMLQSANRQTKQTLRMFRDRGNVHGFFPLEDDFRAHAETLNRIPNLDVYGDRENVGAIIKDSLGNVMRLIRPIVVMDEGHKAYSRIAMETLYGFNPDFVLELSATPPNQSNWLVDVRGNDLEQEEMIKLPINLKVKAGDEWRDCLREAWEQVEVLQGNADHFKGNTARYIRPILLVQVERTGSDQRESGYIHAMDAKEYLLSIGLQEQEIAIKTSEINDLNDPENVEILEPTCPIRVIITKHALQEGWDCPFAYVLCSLAAGRNLNSMTQLVGRILRQPHALKTGIQALDECYIYCHHAETGEVVKGIKKGLESEGMGDLATNIRPFDNETENGSSLYQTRLIGRRPAFNKTSIFLPLVLWMDDDGLRPLEYDQDILYNLDWGFINIDPLIESLATDPRPKRTTAMRIGLEVLEGSEDGDSVAEISQEVGSLDPVYVTRNLSDIVPNPWIARNIVRDLLEGLKKRKIQESALGSMSGYLIEELRKALMQERDRLAEKFFFEMVGKGKIQFRLRTDGQNWKMPNSIKAEPSETAQLLYRTSDAQPVQKSVFSPIFSADFNELETEFACYIDEEKALKWWHRNVARGNNYGLQGWRKHKVYPDFLFAMQKEKSGEKLVVLETKGEQLENNLDTEYKKKLLEKLTNSYQVESSMKAGELKIQIDDNTVVVCDMVFGDDWKTKLHKQVFSN